MRRHRRHRAAGFTILEIMVALAILGLIVAAIYSSWIAIVRGSRVGLEAAANVQRSRMAVRTLEDALTCARAFAADIDDYAFVALNGDDASLSFVAKLPESFPRSGRFGSYDVRRVTFSLEPGPESGKQLVLRQNPLLMEWDVDEKEHPVVLAQDVKEFKMEFWDGQANEWIEEWTQTNQLPRLVSFTLEWGDGRNQSHPVVQQITRFVSLPAVIVQAGWQSQGMPPRGPGGRPLPGGPQNPGFVPRPGGVPGQLPPGR